MGCDPEMWPPLAATSHLATRWQGGRLNLDWLPPPLVPLRSVRWIRDAFSYFVKINIPIRVSMINFSFKWSSPPEYSMETEETRLAAHTSPRDDEKAFEYPLQRPVSFRAANIGVPTSQAHHRFHGCLHPYVASASGGRHNRRFKEMPHTGSDLRRRKEWTKNVYDLDIPPGAFRFISKW
jgi:hypothetical protein